MEEVAEAMEEVEEVVVVVAEEADAEAEAFGRALVAVATFAKSDDTRHTVQAQAVSGRWLPGHTDQEAYAGRG
jgi:hypothetical protein